MINKSFPDNYSHFFVLFFPGVAGNICYICRRELRQRADCCESLYVHFSLQHPALSPGYAAYAHCSHGASKEITMHSTSKLLQLCMQTLFFKLFGSLDSCLKKAPWKVPWRRRLGEWHCPTWPYVQYVNSQYFTPVILQYSYIMLCTILILTLCGCIS